MFTVKIAIKGIIEENEKVLLMKEAANSSWRPGTWSLPGGKMEQEETLLDTLNREIKEETGLKVKIKGLYKIQEIVAKDKNGDRLVHHFVFVCTKVGGKLKDSDYHVAALKWFSKKEALKIPVKNLAEYYYKGLFKEYFNNKEKIIPLSKIKIWNANSSKNFNDWLQLK